jgi:hypothetical protein
MMRTVFVTLRHPRGGLYFEVRVGAHRKETSLVVERALG